MTTPEQQNQDALIIDQFTKQAVSFTAIPGHSSEIGFQLVIQAAGISKDDRVLDVACGPGLLACALAPVAGHVTGIDLVPAMIQQARARQQEKKLANVSWDVGNVLPLPYPSASFTRSVTRFSFHHFLNPEAVLREMIRVTTGSGKVVVIDVYMSVQAQAEVFNRLEKMRDPSHVRALFLTELQEMMTRAGLINLTIKYYHVEVELEEQLKASFPKPGDAEKFRKAVTDDIGINRTGFEPRRKDGKVYLSYPIVILAGEKSHGSEA